LAKMTSGLLDRNPLGLYVYDSLHEAWFQVGLS
jgi:hypothetical protein